MSVLVMGSGGGLNNTKLKLADATAGDVLKGKKFYSGDRVLKTGTLELTGNAGAGDVLSGVTFYNTDAKTKITGTLSLTGNAGVGDVLAGATFYNTDAKTKQTGTLSLTGNAGVGDVLAGATFYNTDAKTKRTGTMINHPSATTGLSCATYQGYLYTRYEAGYYGGGWNSDSTKGELRIGLDQVYSAIGGDHGNLNKTYSGSDISLPTGYYSAGTFTVDGGNQGTFNRTISAGGSVGLPQGWYNGGTISASSVGTHWITGQENFGSETQLNYSTTVTDAKSIVIFVYGSDASKINTPTVTSGTIGNASIAADGTVQYYNYADGKGWQKIGKMWVVNNISGNCTVNCTTNSWDWGWGVTILRIK